MCIRDSLSVAGMKKYISTVHPEIDHAKNTYVPILSGANMNFDRLRFVSERAVLGEGKEVFMLVTLPDVPGAFKKMQKIIHPRSVTEFSYRYNEHRHESSSEVPKAYIYTSFSVVDREKEIKQVMQQLNALGFEAVDISDNELAKSHGRYLVGGASKVPVSYTHLIHIFFKMIFLLLTLGGKEGMPFRFKLVGYTV